MSFSFLRKSLGCFVFSCAALSANEKVNLREGIVEIKGATKKFRKLILENSKIEISVIPELGGKIYEFISKESGRNQFFKNSIYKRVKVWGVNAFRKEGNWLALGGIEYSFPTEEHGTVYDRPVLPRILENSKGGKELEFKFDPQSDTKGLILKIKITLNPNQDSFAIESEIENPKVNGPQKFQYWINAMLNPGGLDPRQADVKVVFPKSMKEVVTHYPNKLGPKARTKYLWPKEFENFDFWKDGVVGFFTDKPVSYVSFVSAKNREGVLRIHKNPITEKVWNFGPPIDYHEFSDTDRIYIENWSGLSKDFWTEAEIQDGQKIKLTEYWSLIKVGNPGTSEIRREIEKLLLSFK